MALIKSDRKDFMSYSVPYTFIPGTKARAQEINANFTSITDSIDALDTKKIDLDLSNISETGIEFIKNNTLTRNIGEIIFAPIPITDVGVHLLDGTKISEEGIYKDFVKYIKKLYNEAPTANYFTDEASWQQSVSTYGVCGKFVYDSTNNTVRLPKVSDILQGTTDVTALGDLVEAGLPNITGSISSSGRLFNPGTTAGAFSSTTVTGPALTNGGNQAMLNSLSFSASRSSSIYGNSSTVQPQAIKVLYYIVIANSTKTEIQSDIDEVVTDLNGKADTDLTNTTNTGYIKMAGASMPSNKYINLTLGASGTTYTAPANGWFCVNTGNVAGSVTIYNANLGMGTMSPAISGWGGGVAFLPVKKGDIVTIWYSNGAEIFRFVYAVGSESEAQ